MLQVAMVWDMGGSGLCGCDWGKDCDGVAVVSGLEIGRSNWVGLVIMDFKFDW